MIEERKTRDFRERRVRKEKGIKNSSTCQCGINAPFSPENSNWMKYVRSAGAASERNLLLTQEGDKLLFTASATINPRQELRVSYAPDYARERGLPMPEAAAEEGKREKDSSLSSC